MMSNQKVLWIKVWGIAGVQGAITLSWVIYNLYFPLLLMDFGFTKEMAIAILIFENILESAIEPVFGGLSDYQQHIFGSKISLISLGIILSSALFILLPSLVIFSPSEFAATWLLPFLAIVWASAMATFRAPTLSLLGRCAAVPNLPQAASVLTLVGSIVGAFRFDAYGIILGLGAGFAFALGSFTLLIAGGVLRWLNPIPVEKTETNQLAKIPLFSMVLIFTMGIWISWTLRFLMPAVSYILQLHFGQDSGKLAMTIFLILLGLAAIPAGKIATKKGNSWAMRIGSIGTIMALSIALIPDAGLQIFAIFSIVVFFSLVLNGTIPLAINLFPQSLSGLGIGMYFGGFGAGMSSFNVVLNQFNLVEANAQILAAITCLLLVLLWLLIRIAKRY